MQAALGVWDQVRDLVSGCCAGSQPSTLKLNGRTFTLLRLLGEGGFSYVYLARDTSSGRLFALKKIRCPLGQESVREALREVEAYKKFRGKYTIRCLDSAVVQDGTEGGKVVYLFLPFYERGVHDLLAEHIASNTPIPARQTLTIFYQTCVAVQQMHHYRPSARSSSNKPSSSYPPRKVGMTPKRNKSRAQHSTEEEASDDDDHLDDDEGEDEQQGLIGVGNSDHDDLKQAAQTSTEDEAPTREDKGKGKAVDEGGVEPWAHRDIKPANVLLTNKNDAILMDFGSAVPARIAIPNRSVALAQQDLASEHSSMPYRAPELFDVKTGSELTEAVDVWSLGCTLYTMLYGHSPFETSQQMEQGGSIMMAVLGGRYDAPERGIGGGVVGEGERRVMEACLRVKAEERATIDEVIALTKQALDQLPLQQE